MLRSRIFWRLAFIYGTLVLCVIGALGVVVADRIGRYDQWHLEESLRTKAAGIREVFLHRFVVPGAALQERVRELGETFHAHVTLLDPEGGVLGDSAGEPETEHHADRAELREAGQVPIILHRFSATLGRPVVEAVLRMDDAEGNVGFVSVAVASMEVPRQRAEIEGIIWITAGLAGALVVVLGFWQARRIAKPLQQLTEGARRIAARDYGHKVYTNGSGEVADLAQTFNSMSEGLASRFARLEEDRQQLRAILSGMVEGVIALDASQRILFANQRAAQLLDFPAPTAAGRKLWEVSRYRPLQEVVRRALLGNGPCQEHLSWTGSAARSLTVHAAPLPGSPARGAVLVIHDTTELRRLERLRQDFVANVSHELKTPLSVIKACVETLQDGAKDDPEHRDLFLEQITDQSERLHALILDLLSLARIESGTEFFEVQAVTIESIVSACIERHRARAEGNRQELKMAPPTMAGVAAWADEEAVGQILENLVDNALKYTPAGGSIRVGWALDGEQVRLEVEDTGIGIAERDLPRVFERFYRADKARSRQLGGTGLGLAIVKHLAQAMHGNVRAVSQLGKGSTFTVCLPRAPDG
jgi:two-component system phosphate regulon sensor histidine kinase PhoR